MQSAEPLPDAYPPPIPLTALDDLMLTADRPDISHRPAIPETATTVLDALCVPQRTERRKPGAYQAGMIIFQYLYPAEVAALRALDERIEPIGPKHLQLPSRHGTRERATIQELPDDEGDTYRNFVVPALVRALRELMSPKDLASVELVPAVSARQPIDVQVGRFWSYPLRRRIPAIAELLATDQSAAQAAGLTASLAWDRLQQTSIGTNVLPEEILRALKDQMRQAQLDIAAYSPRHIGRLMSTLLVYGKRHDAPQRAYILPRIP